MFKITRKIEYGLIALKHIASKHEGDLTTAKEVTEKYSTPFDMTAKVMQMLALNGLLKSVQGAHGGYVIQKNLSEVSMFDFVQMVEGPIGIAKCLHHTDSNCELISTCNIASPLTRLNEKLISFSKDLSLRDLLRVQA